MLCFLLYDVTLLTSATSSALFATVLCNILLPGVEAEFIRIPTSADDVNAVHVYTLFTQAKVWNTAHKVCRSINASLVTIDTQEKLDFIAEQAAWLDELGKAWTGLHRSKSNDLVFDDENKCSPFNGTQNIFKSDHYTFSDDKLCYGICKEHLELERRSCDEELMFICEKKSETFQYSPIGSAMSVVPLANPLPSWNCKNECSDHPGCYLAGRINNSCVLLTVPGNSVIRKNILSANINDSESNIQDSENEETPKHCFHMPSTPTTPVNKAGPSNNADVSTANVHVLRSSFSLDCPSDITTVTETLTLKMEPSSVSFTPCISDLSTKTVIKTTTITQSETIIVSPTSCHSPQTLGGSSETLTEIEILHECKESLVSAIQSKTNKTAETVHNTLNIWEQCVKSEMNSVTEITTGISYSCRKFFIIALSFKTTNKALRKCKHSLVNALFFATTTTVDTALNECNQVINRVEALTRGILDNVFEGCKTSLKAAMENITLSTGKATMGLAECKQSLMSALHPSTFTIKDFPKECEVSLISSMVHTMNPITEFDDVCEETATKLINVCDESSISRFEISSPLLECPYITNTHILVTSTYFMTATMDCPNRDPVTVTPPCPVTPEIYQSPTPSKYLMSNTHFPTNTYPILQTTATPMEGTICRTYIRTVMDKGGLRRFTDSVSEHLVLETKPLSRYVRKRVSASDPRVSTKGIAFSAVCLITAPFVLMILLDVRKMYGDITYNSFKKVRKTGIP